MNKSSFQLRKRVAELRRCITSAEPCAPAQKRFELGHPGLDATLGGGLACGRLHEVIAASSADLASATGFTLTLARRAAALCPGDPVFWVREAASEVQTGRIHAPGLAELGLDPAVVILVIARDGAMAFRVGEEVARCASIAAVIVELGPSALALADLTASRRLALAAGKAETILMVLRPDGKEVPSAAWTRWRVESAPSTPLPANAPGPARFDIELLRHRAGPSGGRWRVEWDREQACFNDASLSSAVLPLPARQPPWPVVAAADRDWRLTA